MPRTDRSATIDPYHVLVSELMLQQTQVATVIPYFHRFIERFPNLRSLAEADTADVLRLWQGLGYYSRARNLQRAAQTSVNEFGGALPQSVDELLTLPGVGRYTAGAIASIAFGRQAPILDGNVMRVLCRLDQITSDPRDRATQEVLWARAAEILPSTRPGDFNSALMELGALICTPRSPHCLICPVREHCEACAAGVQQQIPAPKKAKLTPLVHRRTFCIELEGRWLIEQRPEKGRWAGLWQFVTVERDPKISRSNVLKQLTLPEITFDALPPKFLGTVAHSLTHRRYEFEAFHCRARSSGAVANDRRWATLEQLDAVALPRPQLRILELLRTNGEPG